MMGHPSSPNYRTCLVPLSRQCESHREKRVCVFVCVSRNNLASVGLVLSASVGGRKIMPSVGQLW